VRIRNKLFITLAVTGLCLVVILSLLMRWSVDRGMLEYVNTREAQILEPLADALGTLYGETESWDTVKQNPQLARQAAYRVIGGLHRFDSRDHSVKLNQSDTEANHKTHRPPHFKKPKLIILDPSFQTVVGRIRAKQHPIEEHFNLRPIRYQEETVGWLATRKRLKLTELYDLTFVKQQFNAFVIISALVILLAMLFAWPLARHFLNPIRRISHTVSGLRQGRYAHVSMQRSDELGVLARDINELSNTLQQSQEARDRWLADTSHELRTPLSILKGELEAMQDGIRDINRDNIDSLYQEVLRLESFVEDLHILNKADIGALHYRKENQDLVVLLHEQIARHQARFDQASIALVFECDLQALRAWVDSTRMHQLMDNVLANSCNYTEAGGRTLVSLIAAGTHAVIRVSDTGPGVSDDALTHLFDRLYRAESSRNRETGGSGLGLAIAKKIAEAHQGRIWASHSDLGGVEICIELPLNQVGDSKDEAKQEGAQ